MGKSIRRTIKKRKYRLLTNFLVGLFIVQFISACGAQRDPEPDQSMTSDPSSQELLTTIADRLLASEDVAAYKIDHDLPISDPQRENEVVASAVALAADRGIDETRTRIVVSNQIRASKIVQDGFQQIWRENPNLAPKSPSLDKARTIISDATNRIVTALGQSTLCPDKDAITSLSDDLQNAGLDPATSDDAAQTATSALCM